jgi:hypothetical protein
MRRFRAPILCAVVLLTAGAVSAQQQRRACDGAVEYWQAFALLPQMDDAQQKIIANVNTAPLDPAAQKLIENSANALTQLHRGAACDACDWNLHKEDGYAMLLPHLAKGRELARLAYLRARQRIAQRQFGPAAQDVCDALVLARRLGADAVVIAMLVEDNVEQTGVDAVGPHLKQLDGNALSVLSDRLAKLPPGASLLDSVRVERQIGVEALIANLNAAPAGDDWRQRLTESMGIGGPENPEGEAQAQLKSVNSPRQLAERLVQLRPLYQQLPDALKLPQEQAHARLDEIHKQAQGIPLGAFVLSDYSRVYDKHQAAQSRLAMLRAAVAVVQHGQEQLKNFPDPSTGQPFDYRASDNGFELQSKLTVEGKPVTLTVGP